jgi:hypothetical protein
MIAYGVASVYAWLEDRDRTFDWLERALRVRDTALSDLKWDPLFAKVRDDPRYMAVLKKMNLPVD